MSQMGIDESDKRISSISEPVFNMTPESADMPEWNSETQVLAFLAEHAIPLKPIEVYGGMIHTGTITFKYRTVQNKLRSLSDSGNVERVQIDTDRGRVKPLPKDEQDRRATYLITESGFNELKNRIGEDAYATLIE